MQIVAVQYLARVQFCQKISERSEQHFNSNAATALTLGCLREGLIQPPFIGFWGIIFSGSLVQPITFGYLFLQINNVFRHITFHDSSTGSGLISSRI